MEPPRGPATEILHRLAAGEEQAFHELVPMLYDEMRQLAKMKLGQRRGQSLQPTELVHEAYVKLFGQDRHSWENRLHFLRAASRAMRHVLVNRARARMAKKRGGDRNRKSDNVTEWIAAPQGASPADLLALDESLERLKQYDAQKARATELRYFGGLSVAKTAEVLGTSVRTIERHLRFALMWLKRDMLGSDRREISTTRLDQLDRDPPPGDADCD